MEKHIYLLENFRNIQELIRFIDQKTNFILVIYGIIMGFFVNISKELELINPFNVYLGIKLGISISLFLLGNFILIEAFYQIYIILFKILKPRKLNQNRGDKCLFYYGDIAGMEKENFVEKIKNAEEEEKLIHLKHQIYEISKIMKKKNDALAIVIDRLYILILMILIYGILSKII